MGSGFALDSIRSMQNLLALKKMHRSRYNIMKNVISKTKTKYTRFNDRNQLTKEELINYKKQIRASIVKERWIVIIKSLSATAIIAVLIIYISKFLYKIFINSF